MLPALAKKRSNNNQEGALSFAVKKGKWNDPIEWGTTIEDVIKFVQIQMYKDMNHMGDEICDSGDNDNVIHEEDVNNNIIGEVEDSGW